MRFASTLVVRMNLIVCGCRSRPSHLENAPEARQAAVRWKIYVNMLGADKARSSADRKARRLPEDRGGCLTWWQGLQAAITLMPSIVREVSAMLVASTIFRAPGGVTSKIFDCTAAAKPQEPTECCAHGGTSCMVMGQRRVCFTDSTS